MSSTALVSVIMPCYNYGRFLSEALESLLAQTYPYWECIIIDDGSTDNTKEVAGSYVEKDGRIKYIFQAKSGVSKARNKGLQEAKGIYIQFLDADDLLERDKFRLQVAFLESTPSVDLIYGNMSFFKDGNIDRTRFVPAFVGKQQPVSGRGDFLLGHLLDDNFFLIGCPLFRRSLYEDVGAFDERLRGYEDWHFWYRAALLHKEFLHDKREGAWFWIRNHGNNATKNLHMMWSDKIRVRKALMQETAKLLEAGSSVVSQSFIRKAMKVHMALLNRDTARLNLFYGNVLAGCVNTLKYAFHSRKVYFAFYDGAYWVKERLKKRYAKTNTQ